MSNLPKVDITKPKWDQSTYMGRVKHFMVVTNPLNLLATPKQLDRAKHIYESYRDGKSLPPGTTIDDVWKAKYLYNSAFHPDTGEKLIFCGRMSCQVPANTFITAGLMAFYKSKPAVIFWQWFNQSFNATVNYSNRSGDLPISVPQLAISYVLATGGALGTALPLNRLAAKAPPIFGRWVPFVAVAVANCVNIPFMRSKELLEGTPIFDMNNNRLGNSHIAAREGVAAVVFSRVAMAIPTMVGIPIVVNHLSRKGFFIKYPRTYIPVHAGICAFLLTFATPMACAFFSQTVTVSISRLEKDIQDAAKKLSPVPTEGFYNKGL